jgi:hypothetical protein
MSGHFSDFARCPGIDQVAVNRKFIRLRPRVARRPMI